MFCWKLDNKLLIFTTSRFMSDTAHNQATTHSHSHDEGGVSEGGRSVIPPDLQTTLDKYYVDESDRRDLGSDTSGPISSRTRRKSKLHRSTNLTSGGDGYDESDNAETGVPSDNEVDDAISDDVVVVSAAGRRPEGRATIQTGYRLTDRLTD